MKLNEVLNELSWNERELVLPFVEEWQTLGDGETHKVTVNLVYPKKKDKGIHPNCDKEITFEVFFQWNEDTSATWSIQNEHNVNYFLAEYLIENSPQLLEFNNRIEKLVNDLERLSLIHFNDKDYLWDNSFSKVY